MNKYLLPGLIAIATTIIVVVAVVGVGALNTLNANLEKIADDNAPSDTTSLGSIASRNLRQNKSASATSTVVHLGVGQQSGATTTLISLSNTQDVDALALNVQAFASTTGSIIYLRPQISNDGVDWYGLSNAFYEPVASSGNNLGDITVTAATGTQIAWTPGTLGQSGRQFLIKNVVGQYFRVLVSGGVASSSVWMNVVEVVRETSR